jgi:hypothetical protein
MFAFCVRYIINVLKLEKYFLRKLITVRTKPAHILFCHIVHLTDCVCCKGGDYTIPKQLISSFAYGDGLQGRKPLSRTTRCWAAPCFERISCAIKLNTGFTHFYCIPVWIATSLRQIININYLAFSAIRFFLCFCKHHYKVTDFHGSLSWTSPPNACFTCRGAFPRSACKPSYAPHCSMRIMSYSAGPCPHCKMFDNPVAWTNSVVPSS